MYASYLKAPKLATAIEEGKELEEMAVVKKDLDVDQYMKTKNNGTVEEDLVRKKKVKSKWILINNCEGREWDRYVNMKPIV